MEQAAEAAAAAAGGMFSAGALFPLEVIKTNLQAHTKNRTTSPTTTAAAAEAQEEEEGAPLTVAGSDGGGGAALSPPSSLNPPPLPPSPPSDSMRRAEEEDGYEEKDQQQRRRQGEEEEMQARRNHNQNQQAAAAAAPSVVSVARDIHSREGLPGFYKGVWYASGQSGLEKAAYFYGYGWLKALALRGGGGGGGGELSTVADLGLGYLAEAFHLPFTIPIEVVLTKIMTSKDKTNAFAVIQGILAESGPAGFYNGIQAYVVLCLKPAIQYAVFNRIKAITLAYRSGERGPGGGTKELTAVQAFVIGAISRAVATVLVFPYIRAKVIIMSRTGKEAGGAKAPSILASLVTILKEDGVSALFQGIAPEITRGVLSAALMLMVKEKIHAGVKAAIVGQRV